MKERLTKRPEKQMLNIYGYTKLEVQGETALFKETPDFPLNDPWSQHTRKTIVEAKRRNNFKGDFFEAGLGDARNPISALVHKDEGKITGVELDPWRLDIAKQNLTLHGVPEDKLLLHKGDVVEFLQNLPEENKLKGWGVACLPQAPGLETKNHADGFDPNLNSLAKIKDLKLEGHPIDDVGLTLNAAFLNALRDKTEAEFNLLITLSDRIPKGIKKELFQKTGWKVIEEYQTEKPIQQDPDTGIAFCQKFDDGSLFFEKNKENEYTSISAQEAEKRRKISDEDGGRKDLNVYHHLTVYHLKPKGEVKVYENK